MIRIKNSILLTLLFLSVGSPLAYAQDKTLIDYPRKEAIALLEAGGPELVKKHGEEMLDFIYLTLIPTDEEVLEIVSSPNKQDIRKKQDLPVFKALKSGGETSLELIRHTDFFKYPRHLSDLEVIAFLLHDLKGQKEAITFAEAIMLGKTGYERDNWQTILKLINNDELSKGYFFYNKIPHTSIKMTNVDLLRSQMKKQIHDMPDSEHSSFFANHYRFQKILQALLTYYSTEKVWPESLYLLAEKKLVEMPEISFMDAEGFAHLPRLLSQLKEGDKPQKVIWLQVPDEKYTLEGFLDGDINIITTQAK